ncbi:sulfotransferase family 2 domain-containing protein [Alteromonas sp.]|jgi:hypothetical protein|uniref:sulfotransferase family 2 domain-containing protein n=1 Tax=Alteromonas sp. TaxID=232 RepID=UPI00257F4072|nr:sulfotransferase family 2 domain-containing protein [Alteromonas sp.]MBR9895060.1 sulfotransferase family 2 domain-containing protein [Gammaproteobacteria bacterium]NQY19099.1 sulfotransferase family 2 domain-containing protein [Alteromonas sp.]
MNILSDIKYAKRLLIDEPLNKKICYVHIPKCGGTALQKAIVASYGIKNYLNQSARFVLDAGASKRATEIKGGDLVEQRFTLLHYALNSRAKFVSGHFSINEDVLNKYGNEWHFITLMRDPLEKWVSNFFFNKYNTDNAHAWKIDDDIEDYLKTERAKKDGCDYATQILGMSHNEINMSEEAINKAASLFKRFSVIGFVDEMNEFEHQFQRCFGVPLALKSENASPVRADKKVLSEDILREIKALCEPNIAIYNAVKHG